MYMVAGCVYVCGEMGMYDRWEAGIQGEACFLSVLGKVGVNV